jgi:exopolysaccharide biosynthesis polyprenyl glycosylphosphotransferase
MSGLDAGPEATAAIPPTGGGSTVLAGPASSLERPTLTRYPRSARLLQLLFPLVAVPELALLGLLAGPAAPIAVGMVLVGAFLLYSPTLDRVFAIHRSRSATNRAVVTSRLLGDAGAILLGIVVADQLQEGLASRALEGIVDHPQAVSLFSLIVIVTWLVLFAAFDLYDSRRLTHAFEEFKLVIQAVTMGTVAAVFVAFLSRSVAPRSWVIATWLTCLLGVLVVRLLYRRVFRSLRLSGVLSTRMVIIGAAREGRNLYRILTTSARHLGFQVVGFLDEQEEHLRAPDVIGRPSMIRSVVLEHDVHAVLMAGGSLPTETAEQVYRDLQGLPVDLHVSTGLLGVAASRVAVQRFGDAPVLGLRRVELTGFQQTLKRAFDIVVGSLTLVLLSPLMLACAAAVRLTSPGPVLFRQPRVGRDGKLFVMYKFRSMVVDAERQLVEMRELNEADGPLFKLQRDPRVTPVGRLLRAWSLDELPQLFDVLQGSMSLVGPRPPLATEVETYDRWVRGRLRVKPGMTGLWQVSGRHRLSYEDYVHYDLFYVENWSLTMDLFILLRTLPAVLGRTGI